ncbi:Sedlin [Coniochaeta ligniaria NRRL 30616]|uniref:Sedlin n=1 Tax=Coniochaeta ligniaria NRRL 30616 TaxID=1408157 RepID=A0A1J7INV7_9PEZI|nr:Sedlin [Coniochaeta ligniaria NRRL 30616]
MATTIPSIACLGVIGRNNNPLHITIFPSYDPKTNTASTPVRTPLQFSLLLSSSLDVFDLRLRTTAGASVSGDLGLLHAIDERLAVYGFETNTGTRFVVIVDMRGRRADARVASGKGGAAAAVVGLREGEMKPVFKAMQTAYVKLLQNPFYDPDEHSPPTGVGGKRITSRLFAEDMRRIGETWIPGVTSL